MIRGLRVTTWLPLLEKETSGMVETQIRVGLVVPKKNFPEEWDVPVVCSNAHLITSGHILRYACGRESREMSARQMRER